MKIIKKEICVQFLVDVLGDTVKLGRTISLTKEMSSFPYKIKKPVLLKTLIQVNNF